METLTAQAVGYACGDAVLIRDRYSRLGAATGAASILHGCFLALASGLIEGAEGIRSIPNSALRTVALQVRQVCFDTLTPHAKHGRRMRL